MATIQLRRGTGPPTALSDGEPAIDMTPATPRLYAGVAGAPRLLADPAAIEALEARVRLLERAVRDLQFTAWVGLPTNEIPP
jgi:hypothetical protein